MSNEFGVTAESESGHPTGVTLSIVVREYQPGAFSMIGKAKRMSLLRMTARSGPLWEDLNRTQLPK
jgi:hypothetical protein